MNHSSTTRREFTKSFSAGVAIVTTGSGLGSSTTYGTETKKLGVALVGLGKLASEQLAPAFARTKHCRLSSVVTGDTDKARQWSERFQIASEHLYNYQSFDRIIDDSTIDIVYIALPNGLHEEFTLRAAKAGKHVLCETPMATSVEEGRRMISACQAAQCKLAIARRSPFEANQSQRVELFQHQHSGRLQSIQAGLGFACKDFDSWRLNEKLAGGGVLMDAGVQAIQAIRCLSGQDPISITAQETKTDSVKFAQVDESITWAMNYADGLVAHARVSCNARPLNYLNAQADNGRIRLDSAFDHWASRSRSADLATSVSFANELDNFARCILGDRSDYVMGDEGLRDLKIIEAIYRSMREGQTVSVG
jgi:predicted dehydrogenase